MDHELIRNCLNIKIVVVVIVIVGFISSISIVLFSIAIDVVRFISHSILVPPCYDSESDNSNE